MAHFSDMWKAYRENKNGEHFRTSQWYQDNKTALGLGDVQIKVIGVWDTVGALVRNSMSRTFLMSETRADPFTHMF